MNDRKPARRRIRRISVGILLCVLIAGGYVAWCFADNHISRHELYVRSFFWYRRDFDSGEWKKFSGADDSIGIGKQDTRGRMLFNFLRTHQLMHMPRSEVVALLGPPDGPGEGYWIGNFTGLEFDPDVLYIDYDAAGKVAGFHTEQH